MSERSPFTDLRRQAFANLQAASSNGQQDRTPPTSKAQRRAASPLSFSSKLSPAASSSTTASPISTPPQPKREQDATLVDIIGKIKEASPAQAESLCQQLCEQIHSVQVRRDCIASPARSQVQDIVRLLRQHATDSGIIVKLCRSLGLLSEFDSARPQLASVGLLKQVLVCMKECLQCEPVQVEATRFILAVLNFSDYDLRHTLSRSAVSDPIVLQEMMDGVVSAMYAHTACAQVQRIGCAALQAAATRSSRINSMTVLSSATPVTRQPTLKSTGVDAVVQALATSCMEPPESWDAQCRSDVQTSALAVLVCVVVAGRGPKAVCGRKAVSVIHEVLRIAVTNIQQGEGVQAAEPELTTPTVSKALGIQEECVRLLQHLACNSAQSRDIMAALGTHKVVIECMKLQQQQPSTLLDLCIRTLGSLAAEDFFDGATGRSGTEAAVVISDVMLAHRQNEKIQGVACASLGNFGCGSEDIDFDTSGIGGSVDDSGSGGGGGGSEAQIRGILTALDTFPFNVVIAENACFALGSFACNADAAEEILRQGGLSLIANALVQHHTDEPCVAREACRTVENIVFSTTNDASVSMASLDGADAVGEQDGTVGLSAQEQQFLQSGIVDGVVAALQHAVHAQQAIVAQSACAALVNLTSCKALTTHIARCGTVEALLQALDAFGDVPRLVEDALSAVDNIVEDAEGDDKNNNNRNGGDDDDDDYSDIGAKGLNSVAGVSVLVKVMANYVDLDNHNIQLHLCKCLRMLSFDESLREHIGKLGGIDGLLLAMSIFSDSEEMQDVVCTALANLAHDNDNAHRIAVNDGVRSIVTAMKLHAASADIQQEACRAIRVLGKISVNRQHLQREGGITAVLEAVTRHISSIPLVAQACKALLVLSDSAATAAVIFSEGALNVALQLIGHVATVPLEQQQSLEYRNQVLRQLTHLYSALLRRRGSIDAEDCDVELPAVDTMKACTTLVSVMQDAQATLPLRRLCATALSQALAQGDRSDGDGDGDDNNSDNDNDNDSGGENVATWAKQAVSCILDLVRETPEDLSIQKPAFEALKRVGEISAQFQDCIVATGGVACILTALRSHGMSSSAAMCRDCCTLLADFARSGHAKSTWQPGLQSILTHVLYQWSGDQKIVGLAFVVLQQQLIESPRDFFSAGQGVDVKAVLRAMSSCAGTAHVQVAALRLLVGACEHDGEQAALLLKHGGVGHVITAIARHRRNARVAAVGFRCLRQVLGYEIPLENQPEALAGDHGTDDKNGAVVLPLADVFGINGGVEATCQAMQLHEEDGELQCAALDTALRSMASTVINLRHFVFLGVVSLVLDGVKKHVENAALQEKAWAVLLLVASKPRFRTKIESLGGIPAVVTALSADAALDNQSLQAAGLAFIHRMADDRHLTAAVTTTPTVSAVLRAMERHPSSRAVLLPSARVLERVARRKSGCQQLLEAGVVPILHAALTALPDVHEVQLSVLATLKLLVGGGVGTAAAASESGILVPECLGSIIAAMKRFPTSERLQAYCAFVLAHGAHTGHASAGAVIIDCDGISELVGILDRFAAKSKLCRLSCAALGALSQSNKAVVDAILANDGVRKVIAGMRHHTDNTEIQKIACALLGNLVHGEGAKERMHELGGTKFVVGIMRKNLQHAQVQTVAVSVLSVLCKHNDEQRRLLGDLGAIDITLQALKLHAADVEFQRSSFHFLRSLGRIPENRDRISELAGVEYVIAAVHARITPETTKKIISSSMLSGRQIVANVASIFGSD